MRIALSLAIVIAVTSLQAREASAGGAQRGKAIDRVKAAVAARAKRIPGGHLLAGRQATGQKIATTRVQKRDLRRGQALADVHRTGATRVRSLGDVLWHPMTHGLIAFAGLMAVQSEPTMALIGAGIVYFSSRSAKKTSDGWLKLENRSIDVLESEGPDAVERRFANQGAKRPAENLDRLRKNRHLRNGSFD